MCIALCRNPCQSSIASCTLFMLYRLHIILIFNVLLRLHHREVVPDVLLSCRPCILVGCCFRDVYGMHRYMFSKLLLLVHLRSFVFGGQKIKVQGHSITKYGGACRAQFCLLSSNHLAANSKLLCQCSAAWRLSLM